MEQYTNIKTDLQIIEDLFCLTEEDKDWLAYKTDVSKEDFEAIKLGTLIPDKIQLENIYNFAYNKGLYLNEITWQTALDEFRDESVKVVAHGSRKGITGDVDLKANIDGNNDFSYGFYLGEDLAQAGMWVAGAPNSSLYIMTFDTNGLNKVQFNVSTDWMLAVSYFRGKLDEYAEHPRIRSIRKRVEECDYVYAPIADNKIFEVIDAFAAGEFTDLQCLYAISATMLGYQCVIKSEKALDNITFTNHLYMCAIEKSMFNKEADIERNTSINKALIAEKKYANSGKYINEILGERILDESVKVKCDISNAMEKVVDKYKDIIDEIEDEADYDNRTGRSFQCFRVYLKDGSRLIVRSAKELDSELKKISNSRKSIREQVLLEMSMSRRDAIDRCEGLGIKFIEHFDKIYNETDENTMRHHAAEMQAWLDSINRIKLSGSNKFLSNMEKINWFFTATSSSDTFINSDTEVDVYEDFYVDVLQTKNVRQSLINLGLLSE